MHLPLMNLCMKENTTIALGLSLDISNDDGLDGYWLDVQIELLERRDYDSFSVFDLERDLFRETTLQEEYSERIFSE